MPEIFLMRLYAKERPPTPARYSRARNITYTRHYIGLILEFLTAHIYWPRVSLYAILCYGLDYSPPRAKALYFWLMERRILFYYCSPAIIVNNTY